MMNTHTQTYIYIYIAQKPESVLPNHRSLIASIEWVLMNTVIRDVIVAHYAEEQVAALSNNSAIIRWSDAQKISLRWGGLK